MSFSIDELTTPLTKAEIVEAIYGAIEAQGTSTSSWKPGAVTRTMIVGIAIVLAGFSALIALIARSGWLSTARGQWLTLHAEETYGATRRAATFAAGLETLTNNGVGVFLGVQPGDIVIANDVTGAEYVNAEAFDLNIGATVSVLFEARLAGSAYSAGVGDVTTIVTAGFDDVVATNAAAWTGLDEMSDAELVALAQSKLSAASPSGPPGAYDHAAKTAVRSTGTKIGVTRTRSVPDGYGNLTTYCATASGDVTGDAADELTDLGAVNAAIKTSAYTLGITHTTASATALTVDVAYEIWCWSDVNASAYAGTSKADRVKQKIYQDLSTLVAAIPIGGLSAEGASNKVFTSAIEAAIGKSFPEVYRTIVATPSADIDVAINEAPTIGTVTGVVNLVQRQS